MKRGRGLSTERRELEEKQLQSGGYGHLGKML